MAEVMTRELTAVVDAYFAMWNEADEQKRSKHIKEAWAEDGHYVDPARNFQGHQALSEMVTAAREHWVGATLRLSSGIDEHHGLIRFGWDVLVADGTVPLVGIDFGVVAGDGRLQKITGFFGELPQR